jgi:V8-like Glu-specific endopeptidase
MVSVFSRLILILFSLLAGCSSCSSPPVPAPPVRTSPTFNPMNPDGNANRSTGVLLRKETKTTWNGAACAIEYISPNQLITAYHCTLVGGYSDSEYNRETDHFTPNSIGRVLKWIKYESFYKTGNLLGNRSQGTVSAADPDADLALVTASDEDSLSSYWIPIRQELPIRNEPVTTIGHPLGVLYTLTRGYVQVPYTKNGRNEYTEARIRTYYGNSGGPLLDRNGYMIGICSALTDEPNLALYVHLKPIFKLLLDTGW